MSQANRVPREYECRMTLFPIFPDPMPDPVPEWVLELKSLTGPIPEDNPLRMAVDLEKLMPANWKAIMPKHFEKSLYWRSLCIALHNEYSRYPCVPPVEMLFRPLEEVAPEKVKVVILGTEPTEVSCDGLAYSTLDNAPSRILDRIFEVVSDSLYKRPDWISEETQSDSTTPGRNDLSRWAKQGVLLLNLTASCRWDGKESYPSLLRGEHIVLGGGAWAKLARVLISSLLESRKKARHGVAFMLWGNPASAAVHNNANGDREKNKEWVASDPGRGYEESFKGTFMFGECNAWLENQDVEPILW